MSSPIKQSAFSSQQRLAIVTHEDHECLVFDTTLFQQLHDLPKSLVQLTHGRKVSRVINANFRQIGPVFR